ncbi:MAG: SAM-dependent chlorinase/fluorinase [Dehalococcoidia bacterium]
MKKISSILLIFLAIITLISGACAPRKNTNMPIVLLTDYGSEDYRTAFFLDVSANEFPEKVVFIAIVAPYVNSPAKYLVFTNEKNQIFVLPDNGLLTYVVNNTGIKAIYEINNRALFDKPMEGLVAERIQGKVGALIASGYNPEDVGSPLSSYTKLDVQNPVINDDKIVGTVVYVDHYGNAVTNISESITGDFGLHRFSTAGLPLRQPSPVVLNLPIKKQCSGDIYQSKIAPFMDTRVLFRLCRDVPLILVRWVT